ncbi:MAG: hypothetical protein IH596_11055 [Bacteroidales bacterium]|nr:hypothetical protein [Bacteroidales bacterium]
MKQICKLTFAEPIISTEIIHGMHFCFPCTCMIEHVDETNGDLITNLEIRSKRIDIEIDETLMNKWGFIKWQFGNHYYYSDLFSILFHFTKKYLLGNFTNHEIPEQLTIKFNEADFTEPINLRVATQEHPQGATLKIIFQEQQQELTSQ